jgi:plasmid stability protein
MTLRLDDELSEALRLRASAEGRSVHQTVLIAIDEYLKRHQREQRIEALAAQAAADYPEVLRRLGE